MKISSIPLLTRLLAAAEYRVLLKRTSPPPSRKNYYNAAPWENNTVSCRRYYAIHPFLMLDIYSKDADSVITPGKSCSPQNPEISFNSRDKAVFPRYSRLEHLSGCYSSVPRTTHRLGQAHLQGVAVALSSTREGPPCLTRPGGARRSDLHMVGRFRSNCPWP